MKINRVVFLWLGLFLAILTNSIAQTTASFGPFTYTIGGNTYQVKTTFTTQSWGETAMLLTLTNTGGSAIDLSGGSEVWFNASASPTVTNYPTLGGLSYPESSNISAISRGNFNLIQVKINFPSESWATTKLAAGQSFSVNFNLGSSINAGDFNPISQSVKLYANGWVRPNIYAPLTINLTGTANQPATANLLDKTTGITTTQSVASGTSVNVFDGDALVIWGSDFVANNTLYKSTYTAQNPLQITAGANASAVTLPYTSSTIPGGTMTITVTGLPAGASTKLTVTATTYAFSKEISVSNGNYTISPSPYDTYSVLVNRYANEASNSLAVPSYASSYSFSGSSGALTVSFSTSTIKPFGVDGWPKYLAMGSITLGDEANDTPLSKTPLNAIFKYSGSGMGDTGILLDDSSPNFPTTKTILQARRLETKYASLYPGIAPPTVMPVMVHYTAQASGGGIGEADVYNDNNLQIHYRNLIRETKKLLSYKDDAHPFPGTFVLSPDLLGAQQQSNTPNSFSDTEIFNHVIHVNEQLASAYQAEGLPTTSLPVFSENWPGYYQSINFLIKTIGQGAIKFGWQENVWATGTSLWIYEQANQAQQQAQAVSSFMNDKMGVFKGQWKPDFVVLDRYEADCFSVRGQNYAYNAQAWDRFVEFAAAVGKNLDLPVMLWQIPGGHLVTKNETLTKYNIQEHSSASGTYFLGDANVGVGTGNVRPEVLALPLRPNSSVYKTTSATIGDWLNQVPNYDYSKPQLQKLADNNIFSILWGGGETIAVAPIGTNGDDDGWLADKLLNYNKTGRVYQQQIGTPTPTIAISSPANNASYTEGTAIPITVSLANTTATKVEFYNGTTLLGTSTNSPFAYTLTNLIAGDYAITAKATTSAGVIASNVVNVKVTSVSCSVAPTVSLATPIVSGSAPASVTLSATASVSCGAITKVEFYNGSTLIGSSTATPYTFNWTNVATGTYSLTAKAYANNTSTTSGAISITVNGSTITMCDGIAPWNSATTYATAGMNVTYQGHLYTSMYWTQGNAPVTPYVSGAPWKDLGACSGSCSAAPAITLAKAVVSGAAPATVSLSASASVNCGAISKVEYYNGSTLIGSSITTPYAVNWTNVAAGAYSVTAKAYANNTSTISGAVSVTVDANTTNICAGVAPWNATTTYATAGTNVTYQGHLYTSMYWTQGNAPVTPYVQGAPWKDIGTCPTSSGRIGVASAFAEPTVKKFTAYPNPAEGMINVEFSVKEDNTEVKFDILDVKGNRVYDSHEIFSKGPQKAVLQLTNLPPQLYLLQVTTGAGQKIGTQKFIHLK
jgi:chitodextrinase